MLADAAGLSGLPGPSSQAAQSSESGHMPGQGPLRLAESSESGTPIPPLARAPSGVSVQGGAHPQVTPTWLWAPSSFLPPCLQQTRDAKRTQRHSQDTETGPRCPWAPRDHRGADGPLSSPRVGEQGPLEGRPLGLHTCPQGPAQLRLRGPWPGRKCSGDWPLCRPWPDGAKSPASGSWWRRHRTPAECSFSERGGRGRGQLQPGPGPEGPRWQRPAGRILEGPGLGPASPGHREGGDLLVVTARPPATPPASAQYFLTLGAGSGEPARPGLVRLIPGRWARLSSGPRGQGPTQVQTRPGTGGGGG